MISVGQETDCISPFKSFLLYVPGKKESWLIVLCHFEWAYYLPQSWGRKQFASCVLIFSCKNSKITICCWTTIDRRMLDPTKKIPHIQGQRRSPSKMVEGEKLHLESNPIPTRDTWRAKTNLVCTRTQKPHKDWARTVFECLQWMYGSPVDCCRSSGCSIPGYGISLLGGGHH